MERDERVVALIRWIDENETSKGRIDAPRLRAKIDDLFTERKPSGPLAVADDIVVTRDYRLPYTSQVILRGTMGTVRQVGAEHVLVGLRGQSDRSGEWIALPFDAVAKKSG